MEKSSQPSEVDGVLRDCNRTPMALIPTVARIKARLGRSFTHDGGLTGSALIGYNSKLSAMGAGTGKRSSSMYAVIKTGGKQYKVAPGEKLKIEQIPADVGAEVVLDQVLMIGEGESVRLGQPTVAGATVKATVVAHGRGDKVSIFKMRRRKHYQKHQGHRQNYTELKIDSIVG
jgi:large subunit ribosomal protein L21